jgi:hypothetical protein
MGRMMVSELAKLQKAEENSPQCNRSVQPDTGWNSMELDGTIWTTTSRSSRQY